MNRLFDGLVFRWNARLTTFLIWTLHIFFLATAINLVTYKRSLAGIRLLELH